MIRAILLAAAIGACMALAIPAGADKAADSAGIKNRHAQIEAALR